MQLVPRTQGERCRWYQLAGPGTGRSGHLPVRGCPSQPDEAPLLHRNSRYQRIETKRRIICISRRRKGAATASLN